MIKNLKHSVTFPTNGISLEGDLSFQPGLTAIIGDNGSGKTFGSIELIRYLLFGKKALRGPAKDYKSLDAQGTVSIHGGDYTIYRGPKTEWIKDQAEETLAVGAEAVTEKCIQLLGFGLDVFDVVCASVQKESDKLSKMAPTARRRLIDEVIGLASNEAVEKECREEAKALKRDADVLTDNLVTPEQPVTPESYRPSSDIHAELEKLKNDQVVRQSLQRAIDRCGPAPTLVAEPMGDVAQLQAYEDQRRDIDARIARAQAELDRIPMPEFTQDELDQARARIAYESEVAARGARPALGLTAAEIEAMLHDWNHIAALQKIGSVEVECPSCEHTFQPGMELPDNPEFSIAQLKAEAEAMRRWAEPLPPEPEGPKLSTKQIAEGQLALDRAADRPDLIATTQLARLEDKSGELAELRRAVAAHEAYLAAHEAWKVSSIQAEAAAEALAAMGPPPAGSLVDLDKAYVEARIFETQSATYDRAIEHYDATMKTIAAKREKAQAFRKGAEALVKARASVKAYLAPSLSRVSSALIHEMSGGVLSHMVVDEDMNVTVDGQDISTLSGAGSTVANLALRLALGQVLVRNILPVFIADEADADLSTSRAQFTAECLGNLKDQLEQIIIITHKEVTVADHVITR